jgi:hypothetical protein
MVRTHPDPPTSSQARYRGAIAQLGERLLCKQEVIGSIPIGSTSFSRGQRKIARHANRDFAMRFVHRLFFNNSDEVKRPRKVSISRSLGDCM